VDTNIGSEYNDALPKGIGSQPFIMKMLDALIVNAEGFYTMTGGKPGDGELNIPVNQFGIEEVSGVE
jgi:hypothetical protein